LYPCLTIIFYHQELQTRIAGKGLSNDQVEALKKSRAKQNAFVNKVRRDTIDFWDLEGTPDASVHKRAAPLVAKSRADVASAVLSGFMNASVASSNEAEAQASKKQRSTRAKEASDNEEAEDYEEEEEGEEEIGEIGEKPKRRSKFESTLVDRFPCITESGVFLYYFEDELFIAPDELNSKFGVEYFSHFKPSTEKDV
jgi:hypothetical protein